MLRAEEDSDDRSEIVTEDDDGLYCAACGALVTRSRWRAEADGRHQHLFVNPAGIGYEITCFAEAPGIFVTGPATLEATWFAGFAWRIACCQGCDRHIGWRFEAVDSARLFFGLISDRLSRSPTP